MLEAVETDGCSLWNNLGGWDGWPGGGSLVSLDEKINAWALNHAVAQGMRTRNFPDGDKVSKTIRESVIEMGTGGAGRLVSERG